VKFFILALLLIALSLPATGYAQNPSLGYIGLFADSEHSYWCVNGVGFYPVEMWIWTLPGQNGMICVEFEIGYAANVIPSTITPGFDDVTLAIGDLDEGLSACLMECQWDWFWFYHQTLYVTDDMPTYCEVLPHPDIGVYQFANCLPGFPVEPCIKFTNLYINYQPTDPECLGTAVESSSWGAIKSIFK
jgi:hypothetical protein